jgi:hypothetical protein
MFVETFDLSNLNESAFSNEQFVEKQAIQIVIV